MNGTVSNLLIKKSFGFIRGENGQEYFFHRDDTRNWDKVHSDWENPSVDKLKVTFNPISTPKGPRAKDVIYTP